MLARAAFAGASGHRRRALLDRVLARDRRSTEDRVCMKRVGVVAAPRALPSTTSHAVKPLGITAGAMTQRFSKTAADKSPGNCNLDIHSWLRGIGLEQYASLLR